MKSEMVRIGTLDNLQSQLELSREQTSSLQEKLRLAKEKCSLSMKVLKQAVRVKEQYERII